LDESEVVVDGGNSGAGGRWERGRRKVAEEFKGGAEETQARTRAWRSESRESARPEEERAASCLRGHYFVLTDN